MPVLIIGSSARAGRGWGREFLNIIFLTASSGGDSQCLKNTKIAELLFGILHFYFYMWFKFSRRLILSHSLLLLQRTHNVHCQRLGVRELFNFFPGTNTRTVQFFGGNSTWIYKFLQQPQAKGTSPASSSSSRRRAPQSSTPGNR